jgi:signal transduction histidine kinase/CheY-like chemotaxis protein
MATHGLFDLGAPMYVPHEFSELRISPRLVSFLSLTAGFIAILTTDWLWTTNQVPRFTFAIGCYLSAALIELLSKSRPTTGRWAAIGLPGALALLAVVAWQNPGLLVCVPLVVILALALLGVLASVLTASCLSAALVILIALSTPHFPSSATIPAIISAWLALGILLAWYLPILQMAGWSEQNVFRVQRLLDEVRDRNADLDQALSDLVHVNRQLDLANERLAAARTIAEEAQRSKSTFVAKVSHEFRTPLNMVIGLTDFLLQRVERKGATLPPGMLEDIRIIHRNSEHLATMINDVLDLSQAEVGPFMLHRQWVNLSVELSHVINVVKPLIDKKNLRLNLSIPDNLPDVYCDPIRIRQVLLNLVSNSARHTESGSICIAITREDGHVTVGVTDTGQGIPAEDLAHIFEPFYRGEHFGPGQTSGSGLGLTVSKQFIEQHNGSIWVESELEKGSTFSFRLPLMPETAPIAKANRWINEDWVWKERTTKAELPQSPPEWRIVICDNTGRVYPLFSRATSREVELVETQTLEQVIAQVQDIPAHMVVFHDNDTARLASTMIEARTLVPDTPLIGCALPLASEHRETPDIVDYLIKPVTRADLRDAVESLSQPPKRMLIVDDDGEVRALFSRILSELEMNLVVCTAADGDEAIQWMRRERFDLVLLDVVMPGMNGWEVLEKKREIAHMRDVPVLIVSAQDPEVQVASSNVFFVTTGAGVPIDYVLEDAFRLAARLLKPTATHDLAFQGTGGS